MQVITIGLDLAKNVFQVHGVDASGTVVIRKALRRAHVLPFFAELPPCLIGAEACSSANYWARELMKLGHTVKLMPPAYVKPYVKRGKNDATDAEAICEAVRRPTMRFVPVKSPDQQAVLMLHRVRALLMRQRTMAVNALRGHLAEFGIVTGQGAKNLRELIEQILAEGPDRLELPRFARIALDPLIMQLNDLQTRVRAIEIKLLAWHRTSAASRRLETIPGVGFITATAIARTRRTSSPAVSLLPGWALHPNRTPAGVKIASAVSPRWVIDTCAHCSLSVLLQSCDMHAAKRPSARSGSTGFSRRSRLDSCRSHLPTRQRGSHGHF